MKQDERNSKISNILLPWQHSWFEPLLIRNNYLMYVTESNFKHRHPLINDAFHDCQQSLSISLV